MDYNKSNLLARVKRKLMDIYYRYIATDKFVIKRQFRKRLSRELNIENPIKFNDKLQWLKLYWRDDLAIKCADKYEVREYVKETIGKEYLNDIYGVFESIEEIDINNLPDKFVLKGTHGSGFNVICSDKNKMDWDKEFVKMKNWLKTNYFWEKREWVYKDIKPRIVCEKFIEQDDGEELRDYRFFCFNGEPKFITVDLSITDKSKTRRNLYDLEWSLMDAEISYPKETSFKIKKPEKLSEMIELSRKLSAPFPHARIDFYYINNKIIFGEITFFHQSGMGEVRPKDFEIEMGNWLELPNG